MKNKGAVLGLSITASLALLLTLVFTVFAAGPYNVEVADRTGFNDETLDDGAIVQYIGDLNTTYGSAGTGTFNSFVRIQGIEKKTPWQQGYNTDGTPEFDTKGGKWTHSILLSEIPTIEVGGLLYWEFFADINESDSTPKITLDDFELWLTDDPELDEYSTFGTYASKIYDYDDENTDYILINDVNQGSGRGDLRYLVPQEDGFDPGDCSYGNPACETYLILFSRWGGKGGEYLFDGGFEEWKVKKYPVLQVSKTVEGSYDIPVSWTIEKTPDATYALFSGESVIHEYSVSVTPSLGDPENVLVSGVITILGDEDEDVNASIDDMFDGSAADITGCSVDPNQDGTYPIASGATVTCTYELELDDPVGGTNVATASYEMDGTTLAFQGSADILASEFVETLTGYPDINVTDDNGESWSTADATAASWTYTETFSCDADEGANLNTAEITETGQTDTATVTLNCYELTVSKTVEEHLIRKYNWDITKSVSPETWDLFTGESGTSEYTVFLDQKGYTDSGFYVDGKITITNPHPDRAADLTQVIDSAGGITAAVDCPSLVVPKGGSLECSYTTAPQSSAAVFGSVNTATATQQLYTFDKLGVATADGTKDYQDTETIDFNGASMTEVDKEVEVDDTVEGTVTGKWTADKTFTYTRTFACDADQGKHDNTASFQSTSSATTDSDSASVMVNCYDLDVTKTVVESFSRAYTWQIDKSVDQPGPISLPAGGSVELTYSVVVDLLSTTDSNFQVTGDIVITNNHPTRDAALTDVSDLAGTIPGVVSCPSTTVPKNSGTLTCTYTTAAQSSASPFGSLNTATAKQQLYTFDKLGVGTANGTKDYEDTEPIDFSTVIPSTTDEMITVTDTYAGTLGTVYATDPLPKTFTYKRTVSAETEVCGTILVDNTASFVTNDTAATGSDSVSVVVDIPCGEGCTPGFWQGGAGAKLWNSQNDPHWNYGGTNPFTHDTPFNDYFSLPTDSRLDGLSMMDLVGSGGTSDWARKAARDMVAAYLNESAFPGTYPAASLAELESMWYAAVAGGDAGFMSFHDTVGDWNDPYMGSCPLP